jgi:RNA polymerase sigma factor (sigma-70 family)
MAEIPERQHPVSDARTDEELVKAAVEGSEVAYTELYGRYALRVRRDVARMCKPSDIEDVVQAVFLKVYERMGQFDGDSQFYTWLRQIAVNYIRDQYRRKQAREKDNWVSVDTVYDPAEGNWCHGIDVAAPDTHFDLEGDLEKLRHCIENLPEVQRRVMQLRMKDTPLKEIAELEGITENAVKSTQFRATAKLRKMLLEA